MSPLVTAQHTFLKHVTLLLARAYELGYMVTLGEGFRTPEQQQIYVARGLSLTLNSRHLERQAIDLYFFKDEKLTWEVQELGKYWESLDPKNRWGGNFKSLPDVPHFERRA